MHYGIRHIVKIALIFAFFLSGATFALAQPRTARPAGRGVKHVRSASANVSTGSSPKRIVKASHQELVAPGVSDVTLEPIASDGMPMHMGIAEPFPCDSCGAVEACGCYPVGLLPVGLFNWSRADVWVGVTSFTGEANFLTTGTSGNGQVEGNFGFQEGVNFGSNLPNLLGGQLGAQIGIRGTQTQLEGSAAGSDNRNQLFATAGLFRRVDYGLQGGLVVDYLHDDWIYQADLVQLRGELSFLFSPCHDLGFRFTDSQQTEETTAMVSGVTSAVNLRLSTLNTYRFFYRYRFGHDARGVAELQTGFTEDSGAVLGLDVKAPLQNELGMAFNVTYVMPPSNVTDPYTREAWNMGVAFVWTPCRIFGGARDYYRPLLDVAHNGNMISRLNR